MMRKPALLAVATQFAPRLLQVRRRTWITAGIGLLVLVGLLIWAAVALLGWLFGQAQGLAGKAPEAFSGVLAEAEQIAPEAISGAREKLGTLVPNIKQTSPPRDVSGTDTARVARYPGLARTYWHREGKLITVEYEGTADYVAVLDHYVKGFAALGYAQNIQSAQTESETHEYVKAADRLIIKIAQKPPNSVNVRIETTLQ